MNWGLVFRPGSQPGPQNKGWRKSHRAAQATPGEQKQAVPGEQKQGVPGEQKSAATEEAPARQNISRVQERWSQLLDKDEMEEFLRLLRKLNDVLQDDR